MNVKGWIVTLSIVVGACLLGWFLMSGTGGDSRADQLARARREKARKKKERERTANTKTESEGSNN